MGGILLAAFAWLLYFPVAVRFLPTDVDYIKHIAFAREIYQTHHLAVPHVLFHLLIIALVKIAGTTFENGALVVLAASFTLTGALVYLETEKALVPPEGSAVVAIRGAAIALVLGAAILLMQPLTKPGVHLYQIGYLWAEPYLNPTYSLMKPLALASAIYAVILMTRENVSRWVVIAAAVTTAAGTLAKPNFAICLVPALVVVAGLRWWRREAVHWSAIAFGLLMPAILTLAAEYYLSYSGAGPQSAYQNSVIFAPFLAIGRFGGYLGIKFIFSVAFPVGVYLLYWKAAVRDFRLNFAFLLFGFGAIYSYFLAEKRNWQHGNFLWSGYVTLFILFVFSATFFASRLKNGSWSGRERLRHFAALALLLLHVHSGVVTEIATLHAGKG